MLDTKCSLKIPLIWQHVREVRDAVNASLAFAPHRIREAAAMAGAELVENAVKYGEELPGMAAISFSISASDERVTMQVSNGSRDIAAVQELMQRVDRLRNAESPESLYLERLEELMDDPTDSGQLGVYRIGFEARFKLACEYQESVVTVTAVRERDEDW
jgi:anti-sigma regulatory factor (Ser/Thr protein kinase)